MIYKVETEQSLETVKSQLEERAKAVGFGVLGHYEFKKILESKGHPINRDIIVYELCNPVGAQSALTSLPEISVYLPCRLSVYEEEGRTVLATIGIEEMLVSVGTDDAFKAFMTEIFDKVKSLMDSW